MPVLPELLPMSVPFEWQAIEESRWAVERVKEAFSLVDQDRLRDEVDAAREAMQMAAPAFALALSDLDDQVKAVVRPFDQVGPVRVEVGDFTFPSTGEAGVYSNALQALGRHQYDRAVTLFDQVIARKDTRADAAIYWKAFAQFKSARSADAQASIAQLRRDYPQSRYLADAKVLEADLQRLSGQPINVEDQAVNDDIKILAIQSMQRTDPERALPLLEGVLNSANSLNVKKRALYVLALSEDPRARQILLRYAKGTGTPDLQPTAISYVASRRDRSTTSQDLAEIYESTQDPALRRVVIEAYGSAGDKTALMNVATNTGNPVNLRQTAISRLSNLATPQELWTLYQKETDAGLRTQIVSTFGSMGAVDQLAEIARTDKDVAVRQRAIRTLGGQRAERTGQVLIDLYGNSQDRAIRISIIQALGNQTNATGLVAIARKETNLDLKKQIVSQLSNMAPRSPVAADYLMEMLK
jgi:HEAT repeat protein